MLDNCRREYTICSFSHVTVSKVRRMRSAEYVERIGDKRMKGFGSVT
jgi:3'-phosphoadenosine 5'-phosphosulfate sulfotransferase